MGYGCTSDAHHITASHPDGEGAESAMRAALDEAGLEPACVDYVNAHATSTPLGDQAEMKAIVRVLGSQAASGPPITVGSNKGAIGHLLGAAGAVESAFTILALHHKSIPPTCNFEDFDEDMRRQTGTLVSVCSQAQDKPAMRVALKNSFGFGGTNASLCLTALDPQTQGLKGGLASVYYNSMT